MSPVAWIMTGVPATYAELAAMGNAQERGYAFERYVGELLRREHFEVVARPSAANGRQVDLFASRGERHYLIETKWRKSAAGMAEIDELARRLERGASNVVGVLVSATGFTRTAVARVEQDATRAIVLVDGSELADVERARSLHRLLMAKHDQLIVHRRAAVSTLHEMPATAATPRTPAEGQYAFAGDGERCAMRELAGDFGPVVFCLDLPDLDWSQGSSVAIEIPLTGWDSAGLTQVFQRLDERGWITPAGTWRIHQQGATWSGFGLGPLMATLADPQPRYRGRRMHHSETISYVDTAGGGLYTLTATVARTRPERVSMLTLALRLPGIPLDPSPLQTLVRSLDVDVEPYFRSLPGPVSSHVRLPRELRRHRIRAEALIVGNPALTVADEDSPDGGDEWVLGAVVKNPFPRCLRGASVAQRKQLRTVQELSRGNEYLLCTLGSWHYLSERRDYVIDFVETAQVGDCLLARIQLDWYDEEQPAATTTRTRIGQSARDRIDDVVFDLRARLHQALDKRRVTLISVEDSHDEGSSPPPTS